MVSGLDQPAEACGTPAPIAASSLDNPMLLLALGRPDSLQTPGLAPHRLNLDWVGVTAPVPLIHVAVDGPLGAHFSFVHRFEHSLNHHLWSILLNQMAGALHDL